MSDGAALESMSLLDTTINVVSYLVFIGIILGIIGFRYKEGFWSNLICFFNIFFSSVVAIGFYEDVSALIANSVWAGGLYFWDYISVMGLFCLTLVILTLLTNQLSRVNTRFPVPVETAGNYAILVCCVGIFFAFLASSAPMMPIQCTSPSNYGSVPIANQIEMLSAGPLSAISETSRFDAANLWERQNGRRAAHQSMREGGNGIFDGTAPPRNANWK